MSFLRCKTAASIFILCSFALLSAEKARAYEYNSLLNEQDSPDYDDDFHQYTGATALADDDKYNEFYEDDKDGFDVPTYADESYKYNNFYGDSSVQDMGMFYQEREMNYPSATTTMPQDNFDASFADENKYLAMFHPSRAYTSSIKKSQDYHLPEFSYNNTMLGMEIMPQDDLDAAFMSRRMESGGRNENDYEWKNMSLNNARRSITDKTPFRRSNINLHKPSVGRRSLHGYMPHNYLSRSNMDRTPSRRSAINGMSLVDPIRLFRRQAGGINQQISTGMIPSSRLKYGYDRSSMGSRSLPSFKRANGMLTTDMSPIYPRWSQSSRREDGNDISPIDPTSFLYARKALMPENDTNSILAAHRRLKLRAKRA